MTNRTQTAADVLTPNMAQHTSFVGQRADNYTVTGIGDPIEYEQANGVVTTGVPKQVERYTNTCDECGGTGYYDQIGQIICDGCGMVLSGDSQPVINTEFGDSENAGSSRGFEKMGEQQFGHDPSI